jgi:TP901 family phage tail tape measure protein
VTKIGLGGILSFTAGAALATMSKVTGAFKSMEGAAKQAQVGVSKVGQAAGALALAGLPLTLALGAGAKKAADFEAQMQGVKAVAGATGPEMEMLTAMAKKMGRTTQFSATEVGSGMELMARAGASASQIMEGLPGILNAAAAEGIGLAETTSIVSNIINSMGLSFKDTNRIADVLALTSAKTNSSILSLGESFSYGAPVAKALGMTLEQTAAALGAISDSGLQGSIAGTTFTSMLTHMTKIAPKARKILHELGVVLEDNKGDLLPLPRMIGNVHAGIGKLKGTAAKTSALMTIFGAEGVKAFNALSASLDNPDKRFDDLAKTLEHAQGAAENMAKTRMDSFTGQMKLLGAAAEGFFIEFFGPILKDLTPHLAQLGTQIGNVIAGMQSGGKGGGIAAGLLDAVGIIREVLNTLIKTMGRVASAFGEAFGGDGIRWLTKVIALVLVFAGILAPVIGALATFGFVAAQAWSAISGLWTIVAALASVFTGPLLIGIIAAVVLFAAFYDQIMAFGSGFIDGLVPAFKEVGEVFEAIGTRLIDTWNRIMEAFSYGSTTTTDDWREMGKVIGEVVGFILKVTVGTLDVVLAIIENIIVGLVYAVKGVFNVVWEGIKLLVTGITIVVQGLLLMLVKLADAIGFEVPESIRKMSEFDTIKHMYPDEKDKNKQDAAATDETPQAKKAATPAEETANAFADNKANYLPDMRMDMKAPDVVIKDESTHKTEVKIDGKVVGMANAKHNKEIWDRGGFKATPWQKRAALEHGAVASK